MSSINRSASPTTALWTGRQKAWEHKASMINLGLHVFNPEWQSQCRGKIYSTTFRTITMKIFGSNEQMRFPVQSCTRVSDVKDALATQLMVNRDDLEFVVKQGCTYRKQTDTEEVGGVITVRGLASFNPQPYKWEHPTAIFGGGYHGLKTGIIYLKSGNSNFVIFDRNETVGGYCWLIAANKYSRLQTDFAAFHIWWGPEFVQENCPYPTEEWDYFPKKQEILRHMQFAAEKYGVLPHFRFKKHVASMMQVGDKNSMNRFFKLGVSHVQSVSTDGKGEITTDDNVFDEVNCSVIYNYPGSMTRNRIVDYPGEDTFDGYIGYGMNDSCPYELLPDSTVAVLGNGAFAVENVRTCVEQGAEKVYLVTRRKNLASPRIPCWFVHSCPIPAPGKLVMKMFEPMYEASGIGDPWQFWSVHASSDRQRVNIIQNSRFGIGDVTFLMHACGFLEYAVDTVKRMTKHTLHLTNGRKLTDVTIVLKSLGLLGDFAVDRFHKMKQMVGDFCDGDWRRVLHIDATGMNAANFITFSTGIATTGWVRSYKFLHDYPKEYYRCQGLGLIEQLPVNKPNPAEDKPAYVCDVKVSMTSSIILESMCPKITLLNSQDGDYKYRMTLTIHPVDKMLAYCIKSWDDYQADFKSRGYKGDYVPYPYTRDMIMSYNEDYCKHIGFYLNPEGPGGEPPPIHNPLATNFMAVPNWAADENAVAGASEQSKADHLSYWAKTVPFVEVGKKKSYFGGGSGG